MDNLRDFFEDFLISLDNASSEKEIWAAALEALAKVPLAGEIHVFYDDPALEDLIVPIAPARSRSRLLPPAPRPHPTPFMLRPQGHVEGLALVRSRTEPETLAPREGVRLDDGLWIYLSAVMHCTKAHLAHGAANAPQRLPPPISGRQRDVLGGLAEGKRQKEIAYNLGISENTVAYHVSQLRQRLGCNHSNEIVATAYLVGLLHPA